MKCASRYKWCKSKLNSMHWHCHNCCIGLEQQTRRWWFPSKGRSRTLETHPWLRLQWVLYSSCRVPEGEVSVLLSQKLKSITYAVRIFIGADGESQSSENDGDTHGGWCCIWKRVTVVKEWRRVEETKGLVARLEIEGELVRGGRKCKGQETDSIYPSYLVGKLLGVY